MSLFPTVSVDGRQTRLVSGERASNLARRYSALQAVQHDHELADVSSVVTEIFDNDLPQLVEGVLDENPLRFPLYSTNDGGLMFGKELDFIGVTGYGPPECPDDVLVIDYSRMVRPFGMSMRVRYDPTEVPMQFAIQLPGFEIQDES